MTKADIRTWGAANGFKVGARGRFSKDLIDAYDAAHSDKNYVVASKEPGATRPRTAEERQNEYAQHYPRHRLGEAFQGEDTAVKSWKDACGCGYSIGHCTCQTPTAFNSKDVMVPIYRVK